MNYAQDIAYIREMLVFIKDTAASKADLVPIKADLAAVKDDLAEVKSDLAKVKSNLAEVKSDVAVLKYDVSDQSERMVTKDDLRDLKNELMSHIDFVMSKHSQFELELAAINANYQRHDRQIIQLAERYNITLTN